jgi:hypothetical protein
MPPMRSLPLRPHPVDHETVASYLRRLAEANHLAETSLLNVLHAQQKRGLTSVNVGLLSAAVMIPERLLRYALPELRNAYERATMAKAGRAVELGTDDTRSACHRCMAARGILVPVYRWHRPQDNVCLRHQLWTGPGAGPADQHLDVSRLPELAAAQRRHLNLIRHHRRLGAGFSSAFNAANLVCRLWAANNAYGVRRHRRIRTLLGSRTRPSNVPEHVLPAVCYPETVSLASLFASEHWKALAGSRDTAERDLFCLEVSRRIGQSYRFTGTHDPMARWIREQQHLPISPHAVDW